MRVEGQVYRFIGRCGVSSFVTRAGKPWYQFFCPFWT